jgi:hypothetical protein
MIVFVDKYSLFFLFFVICSNANKSFLSKDMNSSIFVIQKKIDDHEMA